MSLAQLGSCCFSEINLTFDLRASSLSTDVILPFFSFMVSILCSHRTVVSYFLSFPVNHSKSFLPIKEFNFSGCALGDGGQQKRVTDGAAFAEAGLLRGWSSVKLWGPEGDVGDW